MNEYRIQRLKEELTYAQQRNKKQRQQLANYKKVHEKNLKEIERLKEEYVMLQNASDKVEEEKDQEIDRLNNIINELEDYLELARTEVNKISKEGGAGLLMAINKLKKLKGSDKE